MFYASSNWGTIGLNISAFGCFIMLAKCSAGEDDDYSAEYKQIAQIVCAIMIKMFVASLMSPGEPRDIACERLREAHEYLHLAYRSFFDGHVQGIMGLKEGHDKFKDALIACEEIAPKTDPNLEMVPGARMPFKNALFSVTVRQLRLILSDMNMLIMAICSDHGASEDTSKRAVDAQIFQTMRKQASWEVMKDDCLMTIEMTMGLVRAVLEHSSEEPMQADIQDISQVTNMSKLDGLEEFYKQISEALCSRMNVADEEINKDTRVISELQRTRVTVAVNALALSVAHLAELATEAFERAIY